MNNNNYTNNNNVVNNVDVVNNNPDLEAFVRDFIPLISSEYVLDYAEGTTRSWKCQFRCICKNENDVETFIKQYLEQNNETLKIKNKKYCGPKSDYYLNWFYRCHHNTRYEKTRDVNILTQKPNKRFKNTNCPFSMNIKLLSNSRNENYPCVVYIEHFHNHPIQALESFSFKAISQDVSEVVSQLFEKQMTPSMAYNEYLGQLRQSCIDELDFHCRKADRSICPRRRDFNVLYRKYCEKHFGGKNGENMFNEMENKIDEYKQNHSGSKINYQLYNENESDPLIITILTPLMRRVHQEVKLLITHVFL